MLDRVVLRDRRNAAHLWRRIGIGLAGSPPWCSRVCGDLAVEAVADFLDGGHVAGEALVDGLLGERLELGAAGGVGLVDGDAERVGPYLWRRSVGGLSGLPDLSWLKGHCFTTAVC